MTISPRKILQIPLSPDEADYLEEIATRAGRKVTHQGKALLLAWAYRFTGERGRVPGGPCGSPAGCTKSGALWYAAHNGLYYCGDCAVEVAGIVAAKELPPLVLNGGPPPVDEALVTRIYDAIVAPPGRVGRPRRPAGDKLASDVRRALESYERRKVPREESAPLAPIDDDPSSRRVMGPAIVGEIVKVRVECDDDMA